MNVSDCEYIVVGSGAGGGTVAARLAESGRNVILLEAGGDPRDLHGADPLDSKPDRLPSDYDVPAFHAFASENDAIKWDFFVRTQASEQDPLRNPNYRADRGGVLYPRAAALGGCTAHNAMILVYPHNADWDAIAELTGDATWRASHMRRYFERLENCAHRPAYKLLRLLGWNPTRHGWGGWLHTERALPRELLRNRALAETLAETALEAFCEDGHQVDRIRWFLESGLDPNDWRLVRQNSTGVRYLPLTTRNHQRIGSRERVLDVARRYPDRLRIVLNALVTRVILDDQNRAIGVEYLQGRKLYRAHAHASVEPGVNTFLFASREVILAGGAFNTPQILMLSGIGPASALHQHHIPVRVDLPGVGRNLQDRYEVAVVNRMDFPAWDVYKGAKFCEGDPQFQDWRAHRTGIYSTNGSALTLFRRSPVAGAVPDLFCMSLLARFSGYYPGYSAVFAEKLNYLTWVILKAHTRNRSGEVTLRSTDPLDPPLIDFHSFQDGGHEDLTALVDGLQFVRRLTAKLRVKGLVGDEELPGPAVQSDADLRHYIRDHAWGHHACGTCAIGTRENGGVLTSDFRVHGVSGLRVADASVFPRIPGFFIACSVYMLGEKAADVILQ